MNHKVSSFKGHLAQASVPPGPFIIHVLGLENCGWRDGNAKHMIQCPLLVLKSKSIIVARTDSVKALTDGKRWRFQGNEN